MRNRMPTGLYASRRVLLCLAAAIVLGNSAFAEASISDSFGTVNPPTVTTVGALNHTETTATLNATANPNGAATTGWFRYSVNDPGTCNDTFGIRLPLLSGGTPLGSGNAPVVYALVAINLIPGRTYFYCAIAQNSAGTGFGSVLQFTTPLDRPPVLTGTVTYGNAIAPPGPRFVSNVTITAAGSPNVVATTGAPGATAGQYSLTGFGSGSYTITPTKTDGANNITSFDAAMVAQHVAGIASLNATQLIVADVSNDGTVSSFDAALIARYAASTPPFGITGTWKFVPPSRSHASITLDISGEDFSALLMGEVSGNWINTGARSARVFDPNALALLIGGDLH
jgi:hypothetical protein